MEEITARDSGAVIVCAVMVWWTLSIQNAIIVRVESPEDGQLSRDVGADIYTRTKFKRSNQNTCINQKPIVRKGDRV
jgi:DNA-directed RNA polymerase subunit beta